MPGDYASALRRFADGTSLCRSERARIVRAPLRAFSSARLPRPRGTRKSRARQSLPQKPSSVIPAKAGIQRFALALGSLCDAAKGGRIRPARQRGCARGIARIPLQARMACQRNPGRP